MNVNAMRTKINQLNDEIKSSSVSFLVPSIGQISSWDQAGAEISTDDEKNLVEIFAFLSQPAVALPNPDKADAGEKFDSSRVLELMCRWPEAQRFPRESRIPSILSPYLERTNVCSDRLGPMSSGDFPVIWRVFRSLGSTPSL